jgi:hypothetical protein
LHQSLNEYGWVTFSSGSFEPYTNMPDVNKDKLAEYLSRPKASPEHLPSDLQQDHLTRLQMRLNSLANEASAYAGVNMLIVQGVSAGYVVQLLQQGLIDSPDVLVLLQPYFPDQIANKKLSKMIAELDVPILDVWSEYDNPWAKSTVKKRQQFANKLLTMHYRQRQIFGDQGWEQRDARLTKEIVGYIAYLGW